MIYVYPDFYPSFSCTAHRCRHSCCRGWEIDIDADSLARYRRIGGEFGERLKRNISTQGGAHFVLTGDERCPFLRSDGLCDMILELGEDSLCDICAAHPRFYNELPNRLEIGLGLCCEEAVRLLLQGDKPLQLVEEWDDEPETEDEDCAVSAALSMRRRLFDELSLSALPLDVRIDNALKLLGGQQLQWQMEELCRLLGEMEKMDGSWQGILDGLFSTPGLSLTVPNGIQAERLIEYFLFRHFTKARSVVEMEVTLRFSLLSTALIFAVASCGTELHEAVRLYSGEIEYSEENTERMFRYISLCIERQRTGE